MTRLARTHGGAFRRLRAPTKYRSRFQKKFRRADENSNLARNEAALHSNGDLTKSHYDMNLVAR